MKFPETVAPVFNTLQAFDPDKVTLCVGGAALAAHLAAVGVEVPPQADVDVLCPGEYFDEMCATIDSHPGSQVGEFKLRLPYGKPPLRALEPVFDIYPPEGDKTLLPFSATEAMGGTWHPTYYHEFADDSPEVVTYRDYRFLSMARLLVWTACTGRAKDIIKLDSLVPVARETGLISDEEHAEITREYRKSLALRRKHPERYFARVASPKPVNQPPAELDAVLPEQRHSSRLRPSLA
jgi:hypothetical protein